MDPYERAILRLAGQERLSPGEGATEAGAFLATFVDYPPSQRPASFNIEGVRQQVDRKIDEAFKKRGLE